MPQQILALIINGQTLLWLEDNVIKRRAISEVVATILLIAIITTVSFLTLNGTLKKTIENQNSVSDALELKSGQIKELLSIISKKSIENTIVIELLNYGPKDIIIIQVLVDGTSSSYVLTNSDGADQSDKIIRNKILTLKIPKSGQTIQIITDTKNMLKISI